MTVAKVLNNLIRIAGSGALILGLAFWGGRFYELLDLHMALGAVVVLSLWALAVLAMRQNVRRGLAAGAILWGVITLILGPTQTQLLTGDLHWIVQVVHLLLGLGVIALGAVLARALAQVRFAS